jgi:uncharacterized protein YjiS (DUF1127 family)
MTILTLRRSVAAAGAVSYNAEDRVAGRIGLSLHTIARWIARARQRRALLEIAERNDLHLLKDIGVSQQEAFREADKPFWRA